MSTEDGLLELAERCEKATAEQQRDLLEEAFYAIHGSPLDADYLAPGQTREWAAREGRFFAMLRAEAYESAALTLCPPGLGVYTRRSLKFAETLSADCCLTKHISAPIGDHGSYSTEQQFIQSDALVLSLAIAAASLRARSQHKG